MKMLSYNCFRISVAAFFAVLVFLGIGVSYSSAQNIPESYKNVRLWLYPEYDDPRLLVMLEGQIEGTQPPAEVTFLVPSTAEMYSAGSMDVQNNYSGGPPERRASDIPGWDEISYEVQTDTFRVEYYDPIIIGKSEKSISYNFRWVLPISDLEVIVQEPHGATDFRISPGGKAFTDSLGFTSYLFNFSDLKTDDNLQYEISYTREEAKPSLTVIDTGGTDYTLLITILALVAAAVVGWLIWRRKAVPVTRAERRRAARKTSTSHQTGSQAGARFCDQCGNPIDNSYKYCPKCGKEL